MANSKRAGAILGGVLLIPLFATRPVFSSLGLRLLGVARERKTEGAAAASVVFGAVTSQMAAMPAHRFRVGQTVVVSWSGPQVGIPLGPYVIVRLLPTEDGEPHYGARSSADGHERALFESHIKAREERPAAVKPPQRPQTRSRR